MPGAGAFKVRTWPLGGPSNMGAGPFQSVAAMNSIV
jgi:hypothetical protein